MTYQHISVLQEEAIDALSIDPAGVYVDGTFGRGGHAYQILQKLGPKGELIAIDRDPAAIEFAKNDGRFNDARFSLHHGPFTQLKDVVQENSCAGEVKGILLDLGTSSPQLDDATRGFSFLRDGPLDMRMDTTRGMAAADWLASVDEKTLAGVFKEYGEERFSSRIARAVIRHREQAPITTTGQLAEIVAAANPSWEKHKHPATRCFQAIRIFINEELEELTQCLEQCIEVLATGGRVVVISFHSLEDRIVKRFFQRMAKGDEFPADLPIKEDELNKRIKLIGKAIKPSDNEIKQNARARSAVMRIAEKI